MTLPEFVLHETIASLLEDHARYVQGDPSGLPTHVVQARLLAAFEDQAADCWVAQLEQHTTTHTEEPVP